MKSLQTAVESLTVLEVFLLTAVILILTAYSFTLTLVASLKQQASDLRVNNHNLYLMYMQLSASSLDFVNKWQKALDENKELRDRLLPKQT